LIVASYGTGLISARERDTLLANASVPEAGGSLPAEAFATLVETLRRAPQWAAGNVRYAFAEPLVRYGALDPRANQFTDDLLRGSTLAGLSEITRRLAIDLATLTGVTQSINGAGGLSAFGLNPGVAEGTLRIRASEASLGERPPARSDIVVVPETTPELSPVAGIITLGEGNPLSHVQLLARNFGIPNIAIAPGVLTLVEPLENRRVLTAVATSGSVLLTAYESVPAELRELLIPANVRGAQLTVPPVDLGPREPIPLAELRASLSGRVVGPKAANLGELAQLFPGRVAPAVAIPFGIFEEHVGMRGESARARLRIAYAEYDSGLLNDAELAEVLAGIRTAIAATTVSPDARTALRAMMASEFGPPDTYGVFVRSDTNVEDLPEFTGAGLSETLPNVFGTDAIIDSIPRVWSSVLNPRAIAWRSSLLTNPEQVYASVLLMRSVPSDKSGVMVTTNVSGAKPGLTVSAAWGVGGGVGGEATETLVLHPDGSETLVSEAKAPFARRLASGGGLELVPASDGAVLTESDKAALRTLAQEVARRYAPVMDADGRARPWDIEYGFVDGDLTLFQIRPLVERGPQLANRIVAALAPGTEASPPESVALDTPPRTRDDVGSSSR
jgi:phosphoenolpyruvate synthase/pyruvate phosphate dikinase